MVVHDNRKEQIITKALELFSERGYYKTTNEMVAKEVRVTQPFVYHFFKSKEEMFIAVLDKAFQRLLAAFSSVEVPAHLIVDKMGLAFNDILNNNRKEILMVM
ncbi:helix-turn-helix transcriptional regulator [Paenibacillus sp. 7124]|uniref:Helix-turn-helix transcriptional regulator n=1 Tax=Paenibacillus apii TaxID=1850370 RepID=A0A6M1PNX5_9BACL|nr:helix-turn-helix domain-containing protein [Paenibacillus apii]NGM84208.1 helix-turn-helix transcriptional regulator [Paenibacillus apii]NJJ40896.1 helix-turn-helix transcriptional regulator [Paenibacillus apii]